MKKHLIILICLMSFIPGACSSEPTQKLFPTFTPEPTAYIPPTAIFLPTDGGTFSSRVDAISDYLGQTDLSAMEYLDQRINLNYPEQVVDRYLLDGVEYDLVVDTRRIVWIDTAQSVLAREMETELSQEDLLQKAQQLAAQLAPDVNLEGYSLKIDRKIDNYFFRWQDASGFVQVGYDAYGNLLNFCNATGL